MQSRHQPCIWSSYDISFKGESCHDNNSTEDKVATTPGCRDNTWLSRQHLIREEAATTPGYRDISCKDQNVATSISCRDVNFTEKMSRQEQAVATPPSLKTCRNNTEAPVTRPATRTSTRTDVTTRALHVATVSFYWASLLKSKKRCIEIRAQLQNPINM